MSNDTKTAKTLLTEMTARRDEIRAVLESVPVLRHELEQLEAGIAAMRGVASPPVRPADDHLPTHGIVRYGIPL